MKQNDVILVNEQDEPVGTMEKMEAHRQGRLHRAFSVFVFDKDGRMLLQQRAASKYHGGLLWTNTCCSHPYPNEKVEDAASRRLKEEMGFSTPLKKIFSFQYKALVENNLIEHELDHVFTGHYNGDIYVNAEEVNAYVYKHISEIKFDMQAHPMLYTAWFKIAFPEIEKWWESVHASSTVH